MFLYLGGIWTHPMFVCPCMFICPLYVHMPRGVHPPYAPHTPLCSCMFLEALHVWGVVWGSFFLLGHFPYTTLVWGSLPFICTPYTQLLVPCASVCFGDINMLCGHFPFCWGLGGVPPISLGVLGASALEMFICSFLYIFVVHYVSHFYYGSNYYSSSYSGIFWPVISLISDSGSFPDRVSSKLGSAWSGSTTTLDAERALEVFLAQFLCHSSRLHLWCLFWLMPIMLWILHR